MKSKRILIIGAGLSGLAVADICEQRGIDYLIVDARARIGGRIETTQASNATFDLGPAWFWPGQKRIEKMIARFGLTTFTQFAQGDALYEDEKSHVQRARGFASMEGSLRLRGGLSILTDHLAKQLPASRTRLNCDVTSLTRKLNNVEARFNSSDKHTELGKFTDVILAMPPRIAANIRFEPALPPATLRAMHSVPTWMAGQAKALAIYDTPFWRDANLSGDAISRMGPLGEMHDASPEMGAPYALFGFVGTPPHSRQNEAELKDQILQQLIRMFGADAATPKALLIKDWAFDRFAATHADHAPLFAHPQYGLPREMQEIWDNAVQFAGTEVAAEFGGYLEGALEAAEQINFDR